MGRKAETPGASVLELSRSMTRMTPAVSAEKSGCSLVMRSSYASRCETDAEDWSNTIDITFGKTNALGPLSPSLTSTRASLRARCCSSEPASKTLRSCSWLLRCTALTRGDRILRCQAESRPGTAQLQIPENPLARSLAPSPRRRRRWRAAKAALFKVVARKVGLTISV